MAMASDHRQFGISTQFFPRDQISDWFVKSRQILYERCSQLDDTSTFFVSALTKNVKPLRRTFHFR